MTITTARNNLEKKFSEKAKLIFRKSKMKPAPEDIHTLARLIKRYESKNEGVKIFYSLGYASSRYKKAVELTDAAKKILKAKNPDKAIEIANNLIPLVERIIHSHLRQFGTNF